MYSQSNRLYQFFAVLPQFFVGVHEAWTSAYIPKVLKGSPFQISGEESSWLAMSLNLGGIIGSLLSSLADKIGRKRTILVTMILFLITSLILVFANSVWIFHLARIVSGVSMGVLMSVTPLYLGEISNATTRGAANTMMYLLHILGLLFMNLAGAYLTIPVTSLVLSGFNLTVLVGCMCIPESPYYLIMVNKCNEAKASLQKLQGTDDVDQDYQRIKVTVEEQKKNKTKFRDLIKVKSNRRALLVLFLVLNCKQLTGDGVVDFYSQMIFSIIYDEISPEIISGIYYTSMLIFTIIAIFFVDSVSRRRLILTSVFLMSLLSLLFGVYIFLKLHTSLEIPTLVKHSNVVFIVCYAVFNSCLFTVTMMTLSELFPMNVKIFAARLLGVYLFGSLFCILKFFQTTTDLLGMDVPFFTFAGCGFILFILVYVFMFESAGKTLEQIQEELGKL